MYMETRAGSKVCVIFSRFACSSKLRTCHSSFSMSLYVAGVYVLLHWLYKGWSPTLSEAGTVDAVARPQKE